MGDGAHHCLSLPSDPTVFPAWGSWEFRGSGGYGLHRAEADIEHPIAVASPTPYTSPGSSEPKALRRMLASVSAQQPNRSPY